VILHPDLSAKSGRVNIMAFNLDTPGLAEARLDAIATLIKGKISLFNSANLRDTLCPCLLGSNAVTIGDPDSLQKVALTPVTIAVIGGNIESDFEFLPGSMTDEQGAGYLYRVFTDVIAYIHPDLYSAETPFAQATRRERLRSRLSDWLRSAVFNNHGGIDLALASHEFHVLPDTDSLMISTVERIENALYTKAFASNVACYACHLHLTGFIA
jgi:hypothetical protein